MREIKFRAWDKFGRKWFNSISGIDFENKFLFDSGIKYHFIKLELMQFTGLKDKNGKEIYEGDVVKDDFSGTFFEIKFKEGSFGLFNIDSTMPKERRECPWKNLDLQLSEDFEVIGNIYENPELLKGGN